MFAVPVTYENDTQFITALTFQTISRKCSKQWQVFEITLREGDTTFVIITLH